MNRFVLASHNKGKLAELSRILEPMGFDVIGPDGTDCRLDKVEENGETFEENALIKARAACRSTGMPAIADDSGLCVDALGGAPGIYSARFSGTGRDADNNALLLKRLEGVEMKYRTARFVSCIACVFPDGREFTVRGECEGHIGFSPEGGEGFGYDPLFISERGCFGTMSAAEKDSVSHRSRAVAAFAEKIKKYI